MHNLSLALTFTDKHHSNTDVFCSAGNLFLIDKTRRCTSQRMEKSCSNAHQSVKIFTDNGCEMNIDGTYN